MKRLLPAVSWELLLPVLYIGWMVSPAGVLDVFQLEPDEGINLIKAWMMVQGHPLYTAIWSDQPPLLTHFLWLLMKATGPSVPAARLLMILIFATLIWAVGLYTRRSWTSRHALCAQALLFTQPVLLQYSGAVMVGLPAITLAFFSILTLLHWRHVRQTLWLALSALLLALSVLTKLFTLMVLPICVLLLLVEGRGARQRPLWLWSLAFLAIAGGLLLYLVGINDLTQLTSSHLRASRQFKMGGSGIGGIWRHLHELWWLLTLGGLGAWVSARRRNAAALCMLAWTVLALVAFSRHDPIWSHHAFMITIPCAVLAGIAIGELTAWIEARLPRPAASGRWGTACVALICTAIAAGRLSDLSATEYPKDRRFFAMVDHMRDNGRQSDLVVTDMPMFAFRAGLSVPPALAVMTVKRVKTECLTQEHIIAVIEKDKPQQVLLGRFPLRLVREHLRKSYQMLYKQPPLTLYGLRHSGGGGAALPGNATNTMADPAKTDHLAPDLEIWRNVLQAPADWYADRKAAILAEYVLRRQGPDGGWPKHANPLTLLDGGTDIGSKVITQSIDNGSTTSQMRFLAIMYRTSADLRYRSAFVRGLEFLIKSQYPEGGWPQEYPPPAGYRSLATLNDDATVEVLHLLLDVQDERGYAWIEAPLREQAAQAMEGGITFLLRAQIRVNGVPAAWCQQYDPVTAEPRKGRTFEPAAFSSRESLGVLRYLMRIPKPGPEIRQAVESGIAWLERAKLTGIRMEQRPAPDLPRGVDRFIVPDPQADPLWARFYDIESNQPLFVGRDGLPRAALADIEPERRSGYDYYTSTPAELLSKTYPDWRAGVETLDEAP